MSEEATDGREIDNPEWEKAGRVHDWRNHVSDELQALWPTMSPEIRRALFRQAQAAADAEEWD